MWSHLQKTIRRIGSSGIYAILIASALLVPAGCGFGVKAAPVTANGLAIGGSVHGGQQPVGGANIALYATTSGGYNTPFSTPLATATTSTDGSGSFSLTTTYTCPAGEYAYVVASGGNPGISGSGTVDNSAIFLVAAIGPCEQLNSSTVVNINEVTTVAAAYALSGFTAPGGAGFAEGNITAGFSTSSTNAQGLKDAFANAANIVDVARGVAYTQPHSTTSGTAPQAAINSLADILQDCVNSAGPSSPPCTSLFGAAKPPTGYGTSAPVNSFQAALDIAQYPGNNVSTLFGLISASAAFGPTLSTMPNDWTLAVTYTGGQLAGASGLTVDDADNVWASGATNASIVEFTPQGSVLSPTGGWAASVSSAAHNFRNLSFDTAGTLWLADSIGTDIYQYVPGGTPTSPTAGTATALSYLSANSNLATGYDLGIDGDGNVWLGTFLKKNCANSAGSLCAFVEFQKSGSTYTPISTFNGTTYTMSAGEKSMAVDARTTGSGHGNVWIAPNNGGTTVELFKSPYDTAPTIVTLAASGTAPSPQCMAIDASGNAWIGGFSTGLYEVSSTGTLLQTVTNATELQEPNFAVFDGNGNLFLPNFLTSTVAMYSPSFNSGAGTFASPNTGFNPGATFNTTTSKYTGGVLSGTVEAAVDRAGALWLLNQTSGTLVQMLGVAAPVNPVLAAGKYGVKP